MSNLLISSLFVHHKRTKTKWLSSQDGRTWPWKTKSYSIAFFPKGPKSYLIALSQSTNLLLCLPSSINLTIRLSVFKFHLPFFLLFSSYEVFSLHLPLTIKSTFFIILFLAVSFCPFPSEKAFSCPTYKKTVLPNLLSPSSNFNCILLWAIVKTLVELTFPREFFNSIGSLILSITFLQPILH